MTDPLSANPSTLGGPASAVGTAHPPSGSSPRRATRWFDALLLAVAASTVAGVAWWAVVAWTETQFIYAAVLVGLFVGAATAIGARHGTVGPALIAACCTFASLVAAEYFIQRTIAVRHGVPVPLWQDFAFAREVVDAGVGANGATWVVWAIAAGCAGFVAARSGR